MTQPTPEQASTLNFVNSVAEYLTGKLLAEDYLIYWQVLDAVQTPDGWYYEYSTNAATYLLDGTFQARVTAAKGLVALVPAIPAEPRFIARPTVDGTVLPENQVGIPAIAIHIEAAEPKAFYQIGSPMQWRRRILQLDCYARTQEEQRQWQDWLAVWFDTDIRIPVRDHENAGGSLEETWCHLTRIASNTVLYRAEAEAFQVVLTTFLEYIA